MSCSSDVVCARIALPKLPDELSTLSPHSLSPSPPRGNSERRGMTETSVEADGIFFAIFALDRVADFAVIWLLNCATLVIMAAAVARNDSASDTFKRAGLAGLCWTCWTALKATFLHFVHLRNSYPAGQKDAKKLVPYG